MKNKDSSKKLVAVAVVIAILTIVAFVNYYFIKPISRLNEKIEVSPDEKFDLTLLTMAYLNQNKNLSINDYLFNKAESNKYNVAAEYYYLLNGRDHLNEYDKILDIAKVIFDDKKIEVSNFVVNIDKQKCGKEKYSTIEGLVYSDKCDSEEVVYELLDTYSQGDEYVVEFYAATAVQEVSDTDEKCENFETPLSYNLSLINLERKTFYSKNEFSCCTSNCFLEGIEPLRNEILNHIKSNEIIYKLTFRKVEKNFVFYKIKKVEKSPK